DLLITSASIFPAVLGATVPGKLLASIALIPRCLAYAKSVPPGFDAKSIIIPCLGNCCIVRLFITCAGIVLINKSHSFALIYKSSNEIGVSPISLILAKSLILLALTETFAPSAENLLATV